MTQPKYGKPLPPPTLLDKRDNTLSEMREDVSYDTEMAVFIITFAAMVTAVGTISTWGQPVADLIISLC